MKLNTLKIKLRLKFKKFVLELRQTHLKDLRNITFSNIKKIPDIVHLKNLVLFSIILSVVMMAMFVTRFDALRAFYIKESPTYGGVYSHGVVGDIEKINPLFIQDEAEGVATKLIYSGLTRAVSANEFIPDLAESWEISTDSRTYDFKLKRGVRWHDGEEFTADDVIFTISLIQNPDTRSPLSQIWRGVTLEKVNDFEVKFNLPNTFPDFLNVASQAILPEHLLAEIDPKNVKVAEFNTSPVGTGPYEFVRFDQIGTQTEVILDANKEFSIHRPYINQIRLILYEDSDSLYKGLARRQINGATDIAISKLVETKKLANLDFNENYLPEYEVISFNLKNDLLSQKDIRKAISMSINREEIISMALGGNARDASVPILPGRTGFDSKVTGLSFSSSSANELLEKAGYVKGEDGIRRKDGKILRFKFVYINNSENKMVSELIQKQLREIGVDIELVPSEIGAINANYIKPRSFDLILIGQNVGINSDLYSFWHSSQVLDPGLNLAGFSDPKVDKLLELVRKSSDEAYRSERLRQVQEVIIEEQPAIFLYTPLHVSVLGKDIKGSNQKIISKPIDILNNIHNWYIKTEERR